MLGAIIGGGLSLLGALSSNKSSAREAATNRAFQEEMSNTSYQRAMEDLRLAGLNPMLAFSQGGASVPTGAMAQFSNPGLAASQAFAGIQTSGSSAIQAETAAKLGNETIQKIKQEVLNLKTDNERLQAVTTNLGEEYQNLIKQGYNLTEVGNHLRAQVSALVEQVPLLRSQTFLAQAQAALSQAQTSQSNAQTQLFGLDIEAAQSLGNIGREAGQLRPVIEILVDVLRSSRR